MQKLVIEVRLCSSVWSSEIEKYALSQKQNFLYILIYIWLELGIAVRKNKWKVSSYTRKVIGRKGKLRLECHRVIFTKTSVLVQWNWSSCVPCVDCREGQTTSRAVQKTALFCIALWRGLSLLGTIELTHLLSSPLECVWSDSSSTSLLQILSCLFLSIFFPRSFSSFWDFCAKECYKQANLENKIKTVILIIDIFKGTKIKWQKRWISACQSLPSFLPFIHQGTQVWNPHHRWERKQTGWINKSSSAGNYPGGYIQDSYGCSWHG